VACHVGPMECFSMAGTIRLVLALHNHQPIGNFDGVFEQSFHESYEPFLDVMRDYPEIPFALHVSGSLLEWLESHKPEYVGRLKQLVADRQVEIVGGAFFEPILSNVPRRDRVGQIRLFTEHLNQLFQTSVRGMWLPERVWEQSFAGDITAAGMHYTIVDDYHFRCAGMTQEQLSGYYVTEDEGRLLTIFPGSERLRYLLPFQDPHHCIENLRQIAEQNDNPVIVFGDDGEKFGSWPETFKHVYEDGWLRRFLDALRANQSWLTVTTPGEVIDHVPPLGRIYLPDASYREMTEWVLPATRQQEFLKLTHERPDDERWQQLLQFTRGGFWRNFRTKYPESNEMYSRMIDISGRVATLEQGSLTEDQTELLAEARLHLYRGQCNCAYWHGAFGGLYLPHLRNAVYSELITADNLLEEATRSEDTWVDVATGDFNFDARQEVRINNHRMIAWLAPASGGHIYELDLRANAVNSLATLNRRPEAYHQKILDHAKSLEDGGGESVSSIHDIVRFKQPDLDKKICYDRWPRKSLVDHFLQPGLTGTEFSSGNGVIGDFANGVYEASVQKGESKIAVEMQRQGAVSQLTGQVKKLLVLSTDRPSELLVRYELSGFPSDVPLHFGVELNFAAMPGNASDRYFYDAAGNQLGTLDYRLSLDTTDRLSLIDEWLGLDVAVECSKPAGFWTMPIETISQSESGFELVHQSACVVPHWEFVMPNDGLWSVDLRLVFDTSIATARQLALVGTRATAPPLAGSVH
jgi:4-alpha-glucanotransferase